MNRLKWRRTAGWFVGLAVISGGWTGLSAQAREAADESYMGLRAPGLLPELFAPGLISTEKYFEISCTTTPDGREFYFTRRGGEFGETNTICVSKYVSGKWTEPEVASFSGRYFDYEPHISPDGRWLYFGTDRPKPAGAEPARGGHIWRVERKGGGWGDPVYVCSGMFASVTAGGILYVGRGREGVSYRAVEGETNEDFVGLSDPINLPRMDFHPFVSPDEDYLVFDSYDRPENVGGADLYVSFREKDGAWGKPANLGPDVNTDGWEGCPYVSRDGKYFFFTREGDIYWVSAILITELEIPKD